MEKYDRAAPGSPHTYRRIPPDFAGDRGLRAAQACAVLGISKSGLYSLVRSGKLPAPVRLSHRVSVFRASDVQRLLEPKGAA
jgi:excisionase family DNA binding protein